jgi:hypothetical protein
VPGRSSIYPTGLRISHCCFLVNNTIYDSHISGKNNTRNPYSKTRPAS